MSCGGLLKKKSLIISSNYRLLETALLQMLPVEYNTVSSIYSIMYTLRIMYVPLGLFDVLLEQIHSEIIDQTHGVL